MGDSPHAPGLYASLRGLVATGVAMARARAELFATELAEERARLLGMLAWGAVALIFLAAGLVFLAVLLTVLWWESHRLLALGVFAALFLGGGGLALMAALQLARSGSRLFSASLAELAQDEAAFDPHK